MTDSPTEQMFMDPLNDDERNDSQNSSHTGNTAVRHTDYDLVGRSQVVQSDDEEWVLLSVIEGRYVAKVLEHTRGNKQAAARILGVDRKTLDRMIKRHHIETQSLRTKTSAAAANSTPQN